jgi:cytochrome c biogenesis protein CcdA
MVLLLLFALIAGAGTAITPCVLPVLPAVLSAGALGGRRRPLGIVLGLAVTFTIAIVALAQLVRGVGLSSGAARVAAIVVLIAAGVLMFVPELAARVQAPLSRLARFGPRSRGDGFWSGVAVGGALGFVCAPCAGPILAAVTSVSASNGASVRIVAVALAYAAGLSAVLLLYAVGGRALVARLRRRLRGHTVERALGAVLLVTAVLMTFNLDVRFEEALARDTSLPGFLVDPTRGLENSGAVQSRLASLRPASQFSSRQAAEAGLAPTPPRSGVSIPGVQTPSLPRLGAAPDFTATEQWWNTPGDQPLSLQQLHGHVVLVDFWTYTCINCIRTLPFLKGLYGNEYWPAEYLIDAQGQVRHTQFGEGDYKQSEAAVRELLYEAGVHQLPPPMSAHAIMASAGLATPETYLDDQRSQGFLEPLGPGVRYYSGGGYLGMNQFALRGIWDVSDESSTPTQPGATISARFQAAHVYLVLTSAHDLPRTVRVLLDGRPISPTVAGADVGPGALVTVRQQRLYALVALPQAEQHELTLEVPPGVSAYDFTFG